MMLMNMYSAGGALVVQHLDAYVTGSLHAVCQLHAVPVSLPPVGWLAKTLKQTTVLTFNVGTGTEQYH